MMSIALLGEFPYPYHLVGLALIVSGFSWRIVVGDDRERLGQPIGGRLA